MGHLGPKALAHLKAVVDGAEVTGEGPNMTKCKTYGVSKAHKLIS